MRSFSVVLAAVAMMWWSPSPLAAQACAPGGECEICVALDGGWHRMSCGTPFLAWTGAFHPFKVLATCNGHSHWETVECPFVDEEEEDREEFASAVEGLLSLSSSELVAFANRFPEMIYLDRTESLLQVRNCDPNTIIAQRRVSAEVAAAMPASIAEAPQVQQ